MKLNKWLLFLVLISHTLIGQVKSIDYNYPRILIINTDTVLAFKYPNQTIRLSEINEERKSCIIELDILDKKNNELSSLIKEKNFQISNYKKIEVSSNEIITIKEEQIKFNNIEISNLSKALKRQKNKTKFSIICGTITTGIMTYFWFNK